MRILKAGCALLLFAFCVVYGVVISIPSDANPKIVDDALAAAEARHNKDLVQLKNPQMNGYLNARLKPFWGGSENTKGPTHDLLAAWANAYSMQGVGEAIDHAALLKAKDPAYLAARGGFEQLLPDLISAFTKPIFQPVNQNFAAPTEAFNKDALLLLTTAMTGFAESLIAEGRPDQAALVYEMCLREGRMIGQDTQVLPTLEGVALQALAIQSMVSHLSPTMKMGPNQWIGLSMAIASTSPTSQTVRWMLENDLAFGLAYLERPRSSYDGDARPMRGAYLLPGMRARDTRVYRNIMAKILKEQAEKGSITVTVPPATTTGVLTGKSGFGPEVLVPDYGKQFARVNIHAAKMTGLAACAGLCAYRAKYGQYPEKLAELDLLKLEAPGAVPWSQVKGVEYMVDGGRKLAVVGVAVDPKMYERAGIDLEKAKQGSQKSGFYHVRDAGFMFRI